jgi:hypothetical protein
MNSERLTYSMPSGQVASFSTIAFEKFSPLVFHLAAFITCVSPCENDTPREASWGGCSSQDLHNDHLGHETEIGS